MHAFMVTYLRRDETTLSATALLQQTRPPDSLLVVNNGPVGDVAHLANLPRVRVVDVGDNVGPAGGWAIAIEDVLGRAADDDWLLFADDEIPPRTQETVANLLSFGEAQSALDPSLGGVGLVGGRFDAQRGRVSRIADDQLPGPIDVDTFGGGHWPLLRIGAIRNVELPDARLFFGFEELEYFLKIRAAGSRLIADGDRWRELRAAAGRTGVTTAQLRGATLPPWRAYYSTRNEIVIAKRFASRLGVGRSIGRGLARATRSLLRREWSSSGAHASGVIDGCFGRLGRRREPPAPDRTPTP